MFAVDRINEDGKKAIVSLLNKSIEVKYAFIFNYPRLIDQLVNIEPITQEIIATKFVRWKWRRVRQQPPRSTRERNTTSVLPVVRKPLTRTRRNT